VSAPLTLPAPSWATAIDGEARSGITWRRVASVKPLAEGSWVDKPREEVEVTVERFDRIDQTPDGFVLTEGALLFYIGDLYDLEQAHRLHAALGELLALVDAEGGAR
jgi:hypothetical protein